MTDDTARSRALDPYAILGVSQDASAEDIRNAYLDQVKAHPPDRSPEQFERVRDAYDLLRDPRKRARALFVAVDPLASFASLADELSGERCFVGPGPWLLVLEERSR